MSKARGVARARGQFVANVARVKQAFGMHENRHSHHAWHEHGSALSVT